MENDEYDYLFKILLIGDAAVGKSSILLRYADNIFNEAYMSTIGIDFRIKDFNLDDKLIKLQIWDTAGQERFKNLTSTYYKGAHGVIFVFDTTDPGTFESIDEWVNEVEKHAGEDIEKVLLGISCFLS